MKCFHSFACHKQVAWDFPKIHWQGSFGSRSTLCSLAICRLCLACPLLWRIHVSCYWKYSWYSTFATDTIVIVTSSRWLVWSLVMEHLFTVKRRHGRVQTIWNALLCLVGAGNQQDCSKDTTWHNEWVGSDGCKHGSICRPHICRSTHDVWLFVDVSFRRNMDRC